MSALTGRSAPGTRTGPMLVTGCCPMSSAPHSRARIDSRRVFLAPYRGPVAQIVGCRSLYDRYVPCSMAQRFDLRTNCEPHRPASRGRSGAWRRDAGLPESLYRPYSGARTYDRRTDCDSYRPDSGAREDGLRSTFDSYLLHSRARNGDWRTDCDTYRPCSMARGADWLTNSRGFVVLQALDTIKPPLTTDFGQLSGLRTYVCSLAPRPDDLQAEGS